MAVYVGTNRTINVGDSVIGRGMCDGENLEGLRGEVRELYRDSDFYVARVRFTRNDGFSFRWSVRIDNIMPADTTDRICPHCGTVLTKKNTKLGARLYKFGMCDDCVCDTIGEKHSYHFGKNLNYQYATDKITLGVELEIDDSNDEGDSREVIGDVIKYARKMEYPLIMSHEHDGSLCGNGFESVTAPLTINDWRSEAVQSQIDVLLVSARDNGYAFYDDDHAGLHVHIGRKDLCGTDRTKSDAVGLLMGWAVTRLWDKGFAKLSRRNNLEYCHLLDEDDRGSQGLYDTEAYGDRYSAVNIENSKTIELRIFKGATCLEDVLLAVDMCYMLGKWATKKINAFEKRGSYSAKNKKYDDCLTYADRLSWSALVKYSKFPDITLSAMRNAGIEI